MEESQKINCGVTTCEYNDVEKRGCVLKEITVEPCVNCDTGTPEESMCGSYIQLPEEE